MWVGGVDDDDDECIGEIESVWNCVVGLEVDGRLRRDKDGRG